MSTRVRRPGEFCWINMVTANPAEAREFYGKLLGWTFGDMGGMGHTIKVGGRDVGGLFDLNSPQTPPGTEPVIGVMVKAVFGWSTEDASFPGKAYLDFKQGADYVAGALELEPAMMKPQWGVYFTVDDVEETARDAQKLGGRVFFDILDIPNVGRMCGIASPQGVSFYTITYTR